MNPSTSVRVFLVIVHVMMLVHKGVAVHEGVVVGVEMRFGLLRNLLLSGDE